MIFDFNKEKNINSWIVVDDVVMGGVSSSRISISKDGNGVFSGHVSLDNNGGFSSIRLNLEKVEVSWRSPRLPVHPRCHCRC